MVLIPFIDEKRLLAAARSVPADALTAQERACNKLGPMIVFRHVPGEELLLLLLWVCAKRREAHVCVRFRVHTSGTSILRYACALPGGTQERQYCTSTVPDKLRNVGFCNSTATPQPPPPPLPDGQLGFTPEVCVCLVALCALLGLRRP